MIELLKSYGRNVVRGLMQLPIRGKSRLRSITDNLLAPRGEIEAVKVGPCTVQLSHRHEATRNMAYGMYEPMELASMRELVKAGDTVLDIGANVGYVSAHLAGMVGRSGAVFAFEPGSTPLEYLRQTAASNSLQNITVIPCAVSGRDGTAIFYETDVILAKGYGRIDERPSAKFTDVKENEVEVLSPSEIFRRYNINCPSFIKIDVEGQEKSVVTAFEPIFERGCFPTLMTEVTIDLRWKEDLRDYATFLARFGYTMHKALPGCPRIAIENLSTGFHGNVFWLKQR